MVNLTALFVSVLVAATSVSALGIQPKAGDIHPLSGVLSSRDHIQVERETNAQRMARGLPPMSPVRRNQAELIARHNKPSQSATPGRTLNGYIQVSDSKTGKFLGYIAKNYQLYGEYGLAPKLNQALKVQIAGVTNGKSGPLQIVAKNGDKTFPNLGGITGYASTSEALTAGTYNYVYLGGVAQTPAFSTPQKAGSSFYVATGIKESVESGVWYFNTNNRKITFGWVNPDGTPGNCKPTYYGPDKVLLCVADAAAFKKQFTGKTTGVTFTLVQ